MADTTENIKKKQRDMTSEIDPETGQPYANIPGVEYPPEVAVAESALYGPMAGESGIANAAKTAAKKAVGGVVRSGLQALEERMPPPSKSAMQQEAIRDPAFNELLNKDPSAAAAQFNQKAAQAQKNYGNLQATKEFGPESSPEASQPLNMRAMNQRSGINEAESSSPPINYAQNNKPAANTSDGTNTLDYSSMMTADERRRKAALSASANSPTYVKGQGIVSKLKQPGS